MAPSFPIAAFLKWLGLTQDKQRLPFIRALVMHRLQHMLADSTAYEVFATRDSLPDLRLHFANPILQVVHS